MNVVLIIFPRQEQMVKWALARLVDQSYFWEYKGRPSFWRLCVAITIYVSFCGNRTRFCPIMTVFEHMCTVNGVLDNSVFKKPSLLNTNIRLMDLCDFKLESVEEVAQM